MLNTSTIRGTFRQIPYWKLRGRFHSCGFRDQEIANAIGIGTDTMSRERRIRMSKPYTLASERADAPSGCAYVAPTFWNKWFRWDGSRASGCYQLGGQVKDENHTGLQIFADGEWHPVIGWTLDSCGPATDYQEVGA